MLIDLHAHSREISTCCRIPAPDVIAAAKAVGLDGIALCNHYQKSYITDGDCAAFAQRYLDEYHYARACGEAEGFRVFFGIEVTMERHDRVHLLIYGVDEDFVTANPALFALTQAELYALVHAWGGILVQAHPFRLGKEMLLDLDYLDGVEANSHPLYDSTHTERLTAIAQSRELILTSGGDYHADTYRPHCGAVLPDSIADSVALGEYLRTAEEIDLYVQEPQDRESRRVTYRRYP